MDCFVRESLFVVPFVSLLLSLLHYIPVRSFIAFYHLSISPFSFSFLRDGQEINCLSVCF